MTDGTNTVVVTGTSSFIGAHIARTFSNAGFEVIATLNRPRNTYTGIQGHRLAALPDSIAFENLDIRDSAAVIRLIDRVHPAVSIHHAGYAVDYGSPDYDLAAGFEVNVAPLQALYQHCATTSTGILITGSAAEYSNVNKPNREDDACFPETPYGLCKLTETLTARQLALHHGVPTRIARVFNPIGGLDDPKKILPLVAATLQQGNPIELSSCTQRRDFIAIEDLCLGYLALVHDFPRTPFDIFNLSSGKGMILKDLLLSVAQKLNADPALLRFGAIPMRPNEPLFSVGANDCAKTILGWHPRPIVETLDVNKLTSTTAF